MTTAPSRKANPNLLYLGLDCLFGVSLAVKRHLGVRMSHQPLQTLECSDLLGECSGLAMRGVGGVHQERSEQKLRLRCVYTVLCCVVLIELRNRKLPGGIFFNFQSDS
jgi:hypothetical protein